MKRILFHIKETRRLPQSVVLIAGRSWKIVDGSHRLTAYGAYINSEQFKDQIDRKQFAWVAYPKRYKQAEAPA